MRIFISSVIRGYESYRDAAAQAITELGHEVLRAEQLRASDATPEQACLQLERRADAVVVLLGERYGPLQVSGLSATHEEYRDARERCAVLVFVQENITPEDPQRAFANEARDWAGGRITSSFSTSDSLRQVVTRTMHDLELSRAVGPVEPGEMQGRAERAAAAVPAGGQRAVLVVAVAAGPRQQLIRPAQLEGATLRDGLLRHALFGRASIFDARSGTNDRIDDGALVLVQTHGQLRLDAEGTVTVVNPTIKAEPPAGLFGGMVIIEEDVRAGLTTSLAFAAEVLDEIDPTNRVTTVAPVGAMLNVAHTEWRTRAEHTANPNTMQPNMFGLERAAVSLTPPTRPRAALRHQADAIAEDLLVVLRREARGRGNA